MHAAIATATCPRHRVEGPLLLGCLLVKFVYEGGFVGSLKLKQVKGWEWGVHGVHAVSLLPMGCVTMGECSEPLQVTCPLVYL